MEVLRELQFSGGSPGYTYAWTGTSQTTLDITNLSAGSYSLTVVDLSGCVVNGGPYSVSNSGGPNLMKRMRLLQTYFVTEHLEQFLELLRQEQG